MKTKLINCNLMTNGRRSLNQEVVIENDRIIHVGDADTYPLQCDIVDLKGAWLTPGFIDVQVNGAGGALFQESPSQKSLEIMMETLRSVGVTSFLPTLTAAGTQKMSVAMSSVSEFISSTPHTVLGLNLEGPFINAKKGGMANAQHIRPYYEEFLEEVSALKRGKLYMTFAPEAIGPTGLGKLMELGIVLSIGHTNASFDQAVEVMHRGITNTTHIFNAMTGISGRDPGVAGAVLDMADIATSFIADGYHVHQANARLAYRSLGPARIFLISDGMPTLGGDVKTFSYEGHKVSDVSGRCTTEDGVLAGTGIDIAQACRNMALWLCVDVAELLPMITSTPARVLGVDQDFGSIAPGYVANLAVTDTDLRVDAVIVRGDLADIV